MCIRDRDPVVPGKGGQPGQRGHHLLHAAAGKIRPAAGTGKQGVPAEQGISAQQRDAALGVAGGVKHLKLQRAHRDAVSLAVEIHAAEGDPGQFAFQREQLGLRTVKIRLMDICCLLYTSRCV